MDRKEIIKRVKKQKIKFIQFWFSDIYGHLKRITRPAELLISSLDDGVGFDGSSIEGYARICESDMRLIPDLKTFSIVPWAPEERKTAKMFCDAVWPDGRPFEGEPRFILKQIMGRAKNLGFVYNAAPEVEYFLLNNQNQPIDQASYFDATGDLGEGLRQQVMLYLAEMGILPEAGHHEVAGGQNECDIRYSDALTMADSTITLKHVIQRVAQHQNLGVTFMPKPAIDKAGSGMHVHQSLIDFQDKNVFYDPRDRYYLSRLAYRFIAGQLHHARALVAVAAPTVNSYKRLVPGFEAPVYICWGRVNRAALIRIPQFTPGREKSVRCELRCPDLSCNPYLAFAVMLAAGLDGIARKLRPPKPIEENVYQFDDDKLKKLNIATLPKNLNEALKELVGDKVLMDTLGPHTLAKFLEAKNKEWEVYCCQKSAQDRDKVITEWELEHYL